MVRKESKVIELALSPRFRDHLAWWLSALPPERRACMMVALLNAAGGSRNESFASGSLLGQYKFLISAKINWYCLDVCLEL